MEGKPLPEHTNLPDSIRLFGLAQAMKFAHLPVAGGIYDQHPQLIEEWTILFTLQGEHQEREQKKQEMRQRGSRGRSRR